MDYYVLNNTDNNKELIVKYRSYFQEILIGQMD